MFQWNNFPIETKIPFYYDKEKKLFYKDFNFILLQHRLELLIGYWRYSWNSDNIEPMIRCTVAIVACLCQ